MAERPTRLEGLAAELRRDQDRLREWMKTHPPTGSFCAIADGLLAVARAIVACKIADQEKEDHAR